jgi:hypothetical protein
VTLARTVFRWFLGARLGTRLGVALLLGCALVPTVAVGEAAAQVVVMREETQHLFVGGMLGVYPMGGGYDLGSQSLDYQGVHWDALRVGFSQRIASKVVMELTLHLGFSFLADPGYVGIAAAEFEVPDPSQTKQANFGWHWGFGIGRYYLHPAGVTLGAGLEISFADGAAVDTAFFRVVPAVGWRWAGELDDWYLHLRWVFGWTVLHGLDELNEAPQSRLSHTGLSLVYGF